MKKLWLVLALLAMGAGCSSPTGVGVAEEAFPNVASELDCNDPEASPTPNSFLCDD